MLLLAHCSIFSEIEVKPRFVFFQTWTIDWLIQLSVVLQSESLNIQGWCLGTYSMAAPMPVLGAWKGRGFGCPEPGAHGTSWKDWICPSQTLKPLVNFIHF